MIVITIVSLPDADVMCGRAVPALAATTSQDEVVSEFRIHQLKPRRLSISVAAALGLDHALPLSMCHGPPVYQLYQQLLFPCLLNCSPPDLRLVSSRLAPVSSQTVVGLVIGMWTLLRVTLRALIIGVVRFQDGIVKLQDHRAKLCSHKLANTAARIATASESYKND